MGSFFLKFCLVALCLIFLGSLLLTAHGESVDNSYSNWVSSAYDSQNTNFDPQNVINSSNVNSLQINWIYQVPVNPFNIPGAPPTLGIETTPLVVNGIAYVATPYNRILALNAATGNALWSYQVNMSDFTKDPWWAGAYVISSLSYYNGEIFMMASDTTVYAFNAISGHIDFTIPNVAKNIQGNTGTYYGEKAPVLLGNKLIVRASTTDYGGRGFVSAYDISTKNLLWTWYSVPAAGGDPNADNESSKGNVKAYPGDWGTTNLLGGGAAWGLMAVDNATGIIYFSTGHPTGLFDSALRPGPNLYADSVIALNSTNGKMIWYYQINSHDVTEHEGGWSITLATVNVNGQPKKAIIQGAKSDYIYVLDAATGKPLYKEIKVGSQVSNVPNDNKVADANLTLSLKALVSGGRICPGPDGGIEMSPAVHNNNLFVVTQNACGLMYTGKVTLKGQTFDGYVYNGDPAASQNATLYSINLANGQTNWRFELQNRYQGSSSVVSGGVVYIVDRAGILYMLDEQSGSLIRKISLGGLGASGVAIARSSSGQMVVLAPAGGGDLPNATPGVLVSFGLPPNLPGGTGNLTGGGGIGGIEEPIIIVLGIIVVVMAMYILLRRRKA